MDINIADADKVSIKKIQALVGSNLSQMLSWWNQRLL